MVYVKINISYILFSAVEKQSDRHIDVHPSASIYKKKHLELS